MDRPAMAFFVVFGEVTRVSSYLIDEATVKPGGGFEFEHRNRAPGEQDNVGPPAALKRELVLKHDPPLGSFGLRDTDNPEGSRQNFVFLRPCVSLRARRLSSEHPPVVFAERRQPFLGRSVEKLSNGPRPTPRVRRSSGAGGQAGYPCFLYKYAASSVLTPSLSPTTYLAPLQMAAPAVRPFASTA